MKIAIMGYGTIGSGVAEILRNSAEKIEKASGEKAELKYVLDLRDSISAEDDDKLIHDFKIIKEDSEVNLVVEAMGGLHPAYEFVKEALLSGKTVVTSNKALVAAFGTELMSIAKDKDVNFFFEASTGGGIPLIRTLYNSYNSEEIFEISGILNGTCNYILTRMREEKLGFEECLMDAKRLGYAEKDPTDDIKGFDTARKLAILISLNLNGKMNFENIHTEGIDNIETIDFIYANKIGGNIRLVGVYKREDDRDFSYVLPLIVKSDDPLYMIDGVINAVKIKGEFIGDTMLTGSGAGKLPTASAMISDIVSDIRLKGRNIPIGWSDKDISIGDFKNTSFKYLVKMDSLPKKMDYDRIAEKFHVDNLEFIEAECGKTHAFVTGKMMEKDFREMFDELKDEYAFSENFLRIKD